MSVERSAAGQFRSFSVALARHAKFDGIFYLAQALELIAGAVNISLPGLNMRDGFKMKSRLRRRRA